MHIDVAERGGQGCGTCGCKVCRIYPGRFFDGCQCQEEETVLEGINVARCVVFFAVDGSHLVLGFAVDGKRRFIAYVEAVLVGVDDNTYFIHFVASYMCVEFQLVEHSG